VFRSGGHCDLKHQQSDRDGEYAIAKGLHTIHPKCRGLSRLRLLISHFQILIVCDLSVEVPTVVDWAFWSQLIEETAMSTALRLFSAEYYDGQMERTLAAAYADAADIGEVLAVAHRIRPGCVSQHSR
jgi:hypothetical protein